MAKPNHDSQQPLSFDADIGAFAGASLPSVTSAPGQAGPQRVVELFAGIGGFRFGLERVNTERQAQGLARAYEVVWANQWEPGKKKQDAARIYEACWGDAPVNADIAKVLADETEVQALLDKRPTMLVAGFPCQDYSVARPQGQGLQGKKGVLWWQIHKLLRLSQEAGQPIGTLLLENVDRLLKSPSKCRGRDFAIILASLQELGYGVAWQVVNAADYGHAQRRRRVFIVGVHRSLNRHANWKQALTQDPFQWLVQGSPLVQALPLALHGKGTSFMLGWDAVEVQNNYVEHKKGKSPFASSGVCIDGMVWTQATKAASIDDYSPYIGQAQPLTLGDVVGQTQGVEESYFLDEKSLAQWRYVKGAKNEPRVKETGFQYPWKEGAVAFPDPLDRPSRTILTSEGGKSAARTTHVVQHADGRLRRLTPEELECLTGFPRGFTDVAGLSARQRAFVLGNALVTGVVTSIGYAIAQMDGDCPVELPSEHLSQESVASSDEQAKASNDEARGSRALLEVLNANQTHDLEGLYSDLDDDSSADFNSTIELPAPRIYQQRQAYALAPELPEHLMSTRQYLLEDHNLMLVPGFGMVQPATYCQGLFQDLEVPCTVSKRALVLQLPSVCANLLHSLVSCQPDFENRPTLDLQDQRTTVVFHCETDPTAFGTQGCRELRICIDAVQLSSLEAGFRCGTGMVVYVPVVMLAGNRVACGGFLIDDSYIDSVQCHMMSRHPCRDYADANGLWENAKELVRSHGNEPWYESAVLEPDYFERHEQAVVYLGVPVACQEGEAND